MINKFFLAILFFSVSSITFHLKAQRQITGGEKQLMEKKIVDNFQQIRTIQCDFSQKKTSNMLSKSAESSGVMFYKKPFMLRWEYIKPIKSTLIINDKSSKLIDRNGKQIGNQRVSKQLGAIIINMINGNSITDGKQFSNEMFEGNRRELKMVLYPKQRRMKDFYNKIEVRIDNKTFVATEIVLEEKTGDRTTILFTNHRISQEISDDVFLLVKD